MDELTQVDGLVLATGGGAVIDAQNRRNLAARGIVVYLHCTPQQQFDRTYKDRNRPLIQTDDPLAKLTALMEVRDPLYREVSDVVVSTENRSANAVTREIVDRISNP